MSLTITPSEADVFTVLGQFVKSILAAEVEVIQAQDNRVPEPSAPNFVSMTPMRMPRLSTNLERQAAAGLEVTHMQAGQFVMQLSVHGPAGADNAQIISTMFRSGYAVDFFKSKNADISPLFADDPRQMPFINAEQQFEDRWIVEANMQVNQTVSTVAQSARELTLGVVSAETSPDSWPNAVITATP